MTDAPAPVQGSESRSLRCLGCLVALVLVGGCVWSWTPKFLKNHWRNQLFDDPTYPATVLAVKHSRVVTTMRILRDDEEPGPGELPGTSQRGNVTHATALHMWTSAREDGTVAPWPTVTLRPGEEEVHREDRIEVTVSAPSYSDQPLVWGDAARPGDWLPGTRCRIYAHAKGWTVQPLPDAAVAAPTSGR